MKSLHRRIVVGLSAAALVAGGGVAAASANAAVPTGAKAEKPVRLIVGLRAGVAANAEVSTFSRFGLSEVSSLSKTLLSEVRAKSIEVPAARATAITAALKLDPNVSYVEVDQIATKQDAIPVDPFYTAGRQPELAQIKAPGAWPSVNSAAVKIAVLDTGVNAVGDLAGKVVAGKSFVKGAKTPADDQGHGTLVSSLIAASHNTTGIAGVCAKCEIVPVKVLNSAGSGSHSDIAAGVIWAAQNGAKIINMSLGGYGSTTALKDAVAYANGKGVLVVAAAGNDETSQYSYPAAYADVLAVGGTDTRAGNDSRVWFSNYGSWVDVSAPGITAGMNRFGEYCWDSPDSPCWDTIYDEYEVQGTSFSSPLVAGVAGLIASRNPTWSNWGLQRAITSSAKANGTWNKFGRVDAAAALTKGTDLVPPTATGFSPAAGAKVRGNVAITPSGLKDDWSGIGKADLYVDGKWHSWSYKAPFAPTLKTAGRNGAIKVQLRISDKNGNAKWLPVRTLTADNVAPTVSITKAPANKKKVKGTVKVYAKASDKSGISKVQLLVNGKVVATDTKAGYVLSFKVSSQKKTMKVRVRAYDKAGNVKYTAIRTYYRA